MHQSVGRLLGIFVLAVILSAVAVPPAHAAITLSGTVPNGGGLFVLLPTNQQGLTGVLKLKFAATGTHGTHLRFCIGPQSSPCGPTPIYVVDVPIGQERLAVIGAGAFQNNALYVVTPNFTEPFTITIE